jgi:hypothetical protein
LRFAVWEAAGGEVIDVGVAEWGEVPERVREGTELSGFVEGAWGGGDAAFRSWRVVAAGAVAVLGDERRRGVRKGFGEAVVVPAAVFADAGDGVVMDKGGEVRGAILEGRARLI